MALLLALINSGETWRTPTFARAHEANRIIFVSAMLVAGQAHHRVSGRGLLACAAGRPECGIVSGGEGARHLRFLTFGPRRQALIRPSLALLWRVWRRVVARRRAVTTMPDRSRLTDRQHDHLYLSPLRGEKASATNPAMFSDNIHNAGREQSAMKAKFRQLPRAF